MMSENWNYTTQEFVVRPDIMADPFSHHPFTIEPNGMRDNSETTFPPLRDKGDISESRNSSKYNGTNNAGFQYTQFYVTRIVMIPCIFLMLLFSLMIVYIIIRHLRAIMKLYLSVIFYAFSILYFATLIVVLLVYNKVCLILLTFVKLLDYMTCINLVNLYFSRYLTYLIT